MIRSEEDFYKIAQCRIAPIYFFDKKKPPKMGEKLTSHGTVTLFRNKHGALYGITNFHAYEEYLKLKEANPNVTCQIGHQLPVDLKNREKGRDERNDLFVFDLMNDELGKIGKGNIAKDGFSLLGDINRYEKEQKNDDPDSWHLHVAGFPGIYKVTSKKGELIFEEDFGIFLTSVPFACLYDQMQDKTKITLDFDRVRKAIEKGKIIPDIGSLNEKMIDFGGMSGGPIFARIFPNENDLTLLGIIRDGRSGGNLLPEILYATPITVIEDILIMAN